MFTYMRFEIPVNLQLVIEIAKHAQMTAIFSYTGSRQLSQFGISIIFFHVSEYILAVCSHGRSNVTLKSLLISKHYVIAMICSLIEYCLEITFFPWLKEYWWISNLGLAMVITGETIRKVAVITAGHAFSHLIKTQQEEQHRLVTHGIYGFVRHPGYSGFLIWSVGTQIMLLNPICIIAFAVVVWKFFARRISHEEFYLALFFGDEYNEYTQRVSSGIPFLK